MFEEVKPVIGPYNSPPLECRKYDPQAVEVARQVAALVQGHLPEVRVEHVGSTSVPGCAGKGIVDLLIAVAPGKLDTVKLLLDRLGFQPQTGPDPFPEDRPMRTGSLVHNGETFALHLHVIPEESPEVSSMRFFRTCLRADAELLRAYVKQKQAILAGGVTDRQEYLRQKGEFLKMVLG